MFDPQGGTAQNQFETAPFKAEMQHFDAEMQHPESIPGGLRSRPSAEKWEEIWKNRAQNAP